MMNIILEFYQCIKEEMIITLATSDNNYVTMRVVSPALYNKEILIFTDQTSLKFKQLLSNPQCVIQTKYFIVECLASFKGNTMSKENKDLREAYEEKFPGAFQEHISFGGYQKEFILLKPTKLKGWVFRETDEEIPTNYVEMDL